jgi:hypothetical protein
MPTVLEVGRVTMSNSQTDQAKHTGPTRKAIVSLAMAFLVGSMFLNFPAVHCSSAVNIAGMDKPTSVPPFSSPSTIYLTQSFTAPGDGMNLSTIVLPLTRWYTVNASTSPGILIVDIYPMLVGTPGHADMSGLPLAEAFTIGASLMLKQVTDPTNFTEDASDIRWQVFTVTPTFLTPLANYTIVVHNVNFTANAGYAWWANAEYNMVPGGYSLIYYTAPPPGYTALATVDNMFGFGFELIETYNSYVETPFSPTIFLSLFLSLALGSVGFGMGKGKDATPAIFLIYTGLVISWLLGWLPAWMLASSFAVLGIMLAYRFRSVISSHV